MSTAAALAATTEMIRSIVLDATSALWPKLDVAAPRVSTIPPDRIGADDGDQLNLFLYRTVPNPGWRNAELPIRNVNGTRLTQPPLALDLHYLLSAHSKVDLHAELLLGSAMLALHGMSALTTASILARFAAAPPTDVDPKIWALLIASSIGEQVEQLTVSLENSSIDDISKLWSVLGEKYRPSASYVVTVALLQPQGPTRVVLPVTHLPVPQAAPFQRAFLATVEPVALPWGTPTPLHLIGVNLLTAGSRVAFGDVTATAQPSSTAQQIDVVLPAAARAGVTAVRVQHTAIVSGSGIATTVEQSNALAVIIAPVVTGWRSATGSITVDFDPPIEHDQDVSLVLFDPASGSGTTIPAPARTVTLNSITFASDTVPAGTYVGCLRVDGADSALTRDANGAVDGPTVVVA